MENRFTRQEQFLWENFVDSVRAIVHSLADQVGQMATRDQVDQLHSDFTAHAQACGHFRQSFDSFSSHFYTSCLRPSASSVVG